MRFNAKGYLVVTTILGTLVVLAILSIYSVRDTKALISNNGGSLRMDFRPPHSSQVHQQVYNISWYNIPVDVRNFADNVRCGFDSCKFSNCKMRIGKEHANSSDLVIFDGRFIRSNDVFRRKSGQIWVFSAHESPISYTDTGKTWQKAPWRSGFNWTMTYDRSNTDIYLPYGEVRKKPDDAERKDVRGLFRNKTKSALIVHSHCPTRSKREQFVSSLQNYLDLDSFGSCGKAFNCGRRYRHDNCFDVINEYKFYLALENALCDQYFTEKLFANFNYDSIMVIRGGRANDSIRTLPTGTFVSTEDFKSIKALADYLNKVSKSEKMYTELLRKKSEYYSVPYQVVYQRAMCDLCERMNKQDEYRKQITNIVDWAYGREPCTEPTELKDLNES